MTKPTNRVYLFWDNSNMFVPAHFAAAKQGEAGAGYEEGVGFHADLQRLYRCGWGVEVLSWECACSRGLKEWAMTNGVFLPLERFYKQVTFVEGGRKSQALSMKGRQWAEPRRV